MNIVAILVGAAFGISAGYDIGTDPERVKLAVKLVFAYVAIALGLMGFFG